MRKLHGPAGPSRQQVQLVLLGLLLSIAAVVAFIQFGPGDASMARASAVQPVSGDRAAAQVRSSSIREAQPPAARRELEVTWPVAVSRDPFVWAALRPAEVRMAQQPTSGPDRHAIERQARATLSLQGIMIDKIARALVNGQLVERGSSIGAYEVMAIEPRAVVVASQGVAVRLALE